MLYRLDQIQMPQDLYLLYPFIQLDGNAFCKEISGPSKTAIHRVSSVASQASIKGHGGEAHVAESDHPSRCPQ